MSKPYVIIISEHRVGSRWLHYMLADLLQKSTSPEKDGQKVKESADVVRGYLNNNKIAKYHHGTPLTITEDLYPLDYKLIGVVRNPRDRGVSRAFHDYYHPKHDYQVKFEATNDFEAVRWIVMNSPTYMPDNIRQNEELMLDGYSTRNKIYDSFPYIWTSYEWLLEDTVKEVCSLLLFLYDGQAPGISGAAIKTIVGSHSFKNKSGRNPGEEVRENTWKRKGQMLDWINWFDSAMLASTQEVQEDYWRHLIKNGGR